jgi:hypothetical protein
MNKNIWKTNATLVVVCVGLAGNLAGCGDDTIGGSGTTEDGGGNDAATVADSTVSKADTGTTPDTGTTVTDATMDTSVATPDTGVTDTGTAIIDSSTNDANVTDTGAHDTGVADVSVADATPPVDAADAGQTLCSIFNSEFTLPPLSDGGPNTDIGDARSWAQEIINGPFPQVLADGGDNTVYNQNTIGLLLTGCAPSSVMYTVNDLGAYAQNMNHFEQRIFGCVNAPAYSPSDGYAFAIVPAEYTGALSQADLDNLVAFYIQQAQLVFENKGLTITPSQITEMTQLLQATESLYPTIIDAGGPTIPACRDFDGGLE